MSAGLKDERDLSVGTRLACGAIAGTTGQTVAYPFDVARRRLQVGKFTPSPAILSRVTQRLRPANLLEEHTHTYPHRA